MSQPKDLNQNYLNYILENSPDGIFTIDFELNIRYVNPAFCRLINFSAKELIGTPITLYLGDLNILDVCMKSVADTGKCDHQETIFKRRDGSMVHISKMVQALSDEKGNVSELLITIRDMTHLHLLNKELSQTVAEREQANITLQKTLDLLRTTQEQLVETEKMASLGNLVAGIAHEINTPIGIGVTSASSLQFEVREILKRFQSGEMKRSELEQFMAHAEQASGLLLQNLEQAANLISSFKLIAVDQASEEYRLINLEDYCNKVLSSLSSRYKNRPISIEIDCKPTIEMNIPPATIYQILSNLVLNSLTHAYEENQMGIIRIKAYQESETVVIEYTDDGKGIDPAHINRVFDPFFTTRRGQGGSGLGLSIVYNLITSALKGKISVNSVLGQGSTFRMKIPAA
jgi:PAS domain S-box-containing protein